MNIQNRDDLQKLGQTNIHNDSESDSDRNDAETSKIADDIRRQDKTR